MSAEVRGTDATGIAYVRDGSIVTYKKPKPAHKVKLFFPRGTRSVIGHTRFTTQGSEKRNCNNHPFEGHCGTESFALAHNGVLFLDELPEFDRRVLESLRQPLENGDITISRASGSVSYPCDVMLVAAMNPCPCGNFGSPVKKCTCTPQKVTAYLNRISQPVLDRIDIQIEVKPVEYEDLSRRIPQESSAAIAERVQKAVEIQKARFAGTSIRSNSRITSDIIGEVCRLTPDRILKVARTCADLAGSEDIQKPHIAQAISFRSLDRKYWNR